MSLLLSEDSQLVRWPNHVGRLLSTASYGHITVIVATAVQYIGSATLRLVTPQLVRWPDHVGCLLSAASYDHITVIVTTGVWNIGSATPHLVTPQLVLAPTPPSDQLMLTDVQRHFTLAQVLQSRSSR